MNKSLTVAVRPHMKGRKLLTMYARLWIVFLVLASGYQQALGGQIEPGKYLAEGGIGYLSIKGKPDGSLGFDIELTFVNGHSCSAEGEIVNQRAVLEGDESDEPCLLEFSPLKEGVRVEEKGRLETCNIYCGTRAAGFDSLFLKPASGCAIKELKASRAEFKRLFDQRHYDRAQEILSKILTNCTRTLSFIDDSWIRNDLALTYFKLGNLAACRKTLQPLVEIASLSDQALVNDEYAIRPMDLETDMPMIKATRTNLKLCH